MRKQLFTFCSLAISLMIAGNARAETQADLSAEATRLKKENISRNKALAAEERKNTKPSSSTTTERPKVSAIDKLPRDAYAADMPVKAIAPALPYNGWYFSADGSHQPINLPRG